MSMNELDEILLEQYSSASKRLKHVKRLQKMMPSDKNLIIIENQILLKMKFYETHLVDSSILKNNKNKKFKIKRVIHTMYYLVRFMYFWKVYRREKKNEKIASNVK